MVGILKAKRSDNGEWVFGFYSRVTANYEARNIHYITTYTDLPNGETVLQESFEIDPETLCRASGLRDVEGNIIWEYDIVTEEENSAMRGIIVFEKYQFAVHIVKSDCVLTRDLTFPLWQYDNCLENGYRALRIVGNEFDNMKKEELVKQETDIER